MVRYHEAEQLDLSIVPPKLVQVTSRNDLAIDFVNFHRANPAVYRLIRSIAFDLQRRGFKHAGMKAIFEKLRWEYALITRGEDYKLNNNLTAFYARLLMAREPALRDFFRTREIRVTFDPSLVAE